MVGLKNSKNIRLIAFYLPQYHPIPENDRWWGKGFTEWANVKKAKPLFPGHYQPRLPADLGFYDLRLPEVRIKQAELARSHGIYGFCYYHYWFMGKRMLGRPLDEVLSSGKPDFPFCLCWANENWTRRWSVGDKQVLMRQRYSGKDDKRHIRWLTRVFKDKRYIRIDGKPLLLVYRTSEMPNPLKTTLAWRGEAKKLGIGEIFLCRVESFDDLIHPAEVGFDASVDFPPHTLFFALDKRHSKRRPANRDRVVIDFRSAAWKMIDRAPPSHRWFPCVLAGFDNSPRRKSGPLILHNLSPQKYELQMRRAIKIVKRRKESDPVIFINAWNEWGEGNYLEPDQRFGLSYLKATRRALNEP